MPEPEAPDLKHTRRQAPRAVDLSRSDRMPSHDIPAEQGVIGCMLLSPGESIGICVETLKSTDGLFFDLRHDQIFKALMWMHAEKRPIDMITVQKHLKDRNQLEAIGGLSYLASLQDTVPSAANLTYYLSILREKRIFRLIVQKCSQAVGEVYENEHLGSDVVLDRVEREISSIRSDDERGRGISNTDAELMALIDDYEKAHLKTAIPGIQTSFVDLDKIIAGLMPQQIIFLGGTPSAGKTSLALNMASNYVFENNGTVGVFSLETSTKKILHRMTCLRFRVNGQAMLAGEGTQGDFDRLAIGMNMMRKKRDQILVCDQGGLTVQQISHYARLMYSKGARLFIIDYLQLISSPEKTPTEKVTAISVGLKNLAKELNCPVIAISSLSLDVVKTKRAPTIGDLRQSGQLGYDADMVWLLHCEDPNQAAREVNLCIAKSKDTDIGDVKLIFLKSFYRFENASRIDSGDLPYRDEN